MTWWHYVSREKGGMKLRAGGVNMKTIGIEDSKSYLKLQYTYIFNPIHGTC